MSASDGRDDTAGALLRAGMALFGELGFKACTTRMIAERAGANIGSIAYYYRNKRGLYRAIAHHISERLNVHLAPDLSAEPIRDADEAERALALLLTRMLHLFARNGEAADWLMLVMREQAHPSEAFDILYDNAFSRVQGRMSELVGQLLSIPADHPRVVMEVHTLVGQVVFFLVGRTPLLRRLGEPERFSEASLALAESVLLSHLAVYRY